MPSSKQTSPNTQTMRIGRPFQGPTTRTIIPRKMVAGKEAEAGEDQHEVPTAVEETTPVQPEEVYSTLLLIKNQKVKNSKYHQNNS